MSWKICDDRFQLKCPEIDYQQFDRMKCMDVLNLFRFDQYFCRPRAQSYILQWRWFCFYVCLKIFECHEKPKWFLFIFALFDLFGSFQLNKLNRYLNNSIVNAVLGAPHEWVCVCVCLCEYDGVCICCFFAWYAKCFTCFNLLLLLFYIKCVGVLSACVHLHLNLLK